MPKCESRWHIKEMLFLKHVGVAFGKVFMPDAAPPLSVNFALNLALRVNAKTAIFTKKIIKKDEKMHTK